ncbi:hypothetical protein PLESTB_000388500 [Pleodorina starrii]|uniref:Thioesterase domain-containing protein n=1 Tax=Pleodorina starrii TaxID=330485 RepID=A0A9W6EYZ9_9CHLO|nr:hypothetical protein PLESTB_000388500 [Pleodorina starrii]GLC73244.1 hypothetical protein PLESTF_001351300 [Pleodorina starrii]
MTSGASARDDAGSRTELARRFVEGLVGGTALGDRPTFDHTALQGLTVVEVAEGRIVCEMPVSERVQNRYGTLHGGATATLVDTISTAALLTTCPHSGVSVHLAVTYLAPMPGSRTSPSNSPETKPNSRPNPSPGSGSGPGSSDSAAGSGAAGAGQAAGAAATSGRGPGTAGHHQHQQQQQQDAGAEVVVIDARVTRVGRQLASMAVELRRKASGQLVATGTHTKFLQVADPAMEKMRARAGAGEARGATGKGASASLMAQPQLRSML